MDIAITPVLANETPHRKIKAKVKAIDEDKYSTKVNKKHFH